MLSGGALLLPSGFFFFLRFFFSFSGPPALRSAITIAALLVSGTSGAWLWFCLLR